MKNKTFLRKKQHNNQEGLILSALLMIVLFLSVLAFAIINLSSVNLSRSRTRVLTLQAQYASESGADAALAVLNSGNTSYAGSGGDVQIVDNSPHYRAAYNMTVTAGSSDKEKYITSTGKVFVPANATTPKYTRKIEIYTERSSTTTSSAMVGRNILYVESGVKNIFAKDVYINGYIRMNKNTTNLIAENVTVADKNTGAGNCSIGGTGNLLKPSSFSDPTQTKTNIRVAYNNCIVPPGNNNNSDFNVSANQSNISKIQSTFIPWGQFMNGTYQNTTNGCNDWTTGSFPREIPSTSGSKRTHYPDSGSGVSSSCGSSGNVNIGDGRYNLNDHVHIRGNLCGSSSCKPSFYNPDASNAKFVFVEGTIGFDSLTTVPGSGPIVFVAYGADPSSKASACPYGGAFYLGNGGDTSAPKAYFLAMNGLCMDKTKFGSNPALGGLSGKNIYIATNPGTPWDLYLDVTFPTNQIPIDLSWKSVRYKRL